MTNILEQIHKKRSLFITRGQSSRTRGQGSNKKGQGEMFKGSNVIGQGFKPRGHKPQIRGQGSNTKGRGQMFEGRDQRTKLRGMGQARGQGSKPDVRGQGLKYHMSEAWIRPEARGSNAKVNTTNVKCSKPKGQGQLVIGQGFKHQRSEVRGQRPRFKHQRAEASVQRVQVQRPGSGQRSEFKHQRSMFKTKWS